MTDNQRELFEKHRPKYPLPYEILTMSRDETICQFCGVSYLIHNEIKKLEDRVKELEENLKEYEILKMRETQHKQIYDEQNLRIQELEEKLLTRTQMLSSLNNDIESKELEINRLKHKNHDHENENNFLILDNERLKKKMLIYDSVVKETMMKISEQKSELKRLEIAAKDQKNVLAQYVPHIQNQIITFINKNQRESGNKADEIDTLKLQIETLTRKNNTHDEQIDYYTTQIDSLQTVKKELNSQIFILNEELDKTKNFDLKYFNLERENLKLLQENLELKNEIENLKLKLSITSLELNDYEEKLNSNQDSINSSKLTYERETKLKNEEIQRLKYELDSLKKRYDERNKYEKEILNSHELNMNEVTKLKHQIQNLNEQISELENERRAMTLAHQCQITQLKDNFKDKLKLNDDWPDKLASELNKEREKHKLELEKLENNLRDNFNMEFEIQQQKYNEMYSKYQQISKDMEGNSKTRINELENEKLRLIKELKNLHEEKLNTEKKLKNDLDNLRNITKELHERLEKYTDDDSNENNVKLKEELIKKNSKMNDLEGQLNNYEKQIESYKDEIKVLQEIVHKECLEREELHEKLEEAREELLNLKKNAYSSQQLIPIRTSINKNNFSSFKNGTGLIDVNNNPDQIKSNKSNTYPRNLNELMNQQKLNQSPSGSSIGSRRNSYSNTASGATNRSPSEKSSADSTAKLVEENGNSIHNNNNKTNMNRAISLMNNNFPSEPIQLFKKINELSKNTKQSSSQKTSNNSLTDNKKRISLLLSRKS